MNKLFLATAAALVALSVGIFACSNDDEEAKDRGGSNIEINCSFDGYNTVEIGEQTWMAENLNCDVKGSYCYGDDPANCDKYGRLYDWETAMKVCPSGWHLPSDEEWQILVDFAGGDSIVASKLKAESGWNDTDASYSGNGTDDYGFSALPGGGADTGFGYLRFLDVGAVWWSSTETGDITAFQRTISLYSLFNNKNKNNDIKTSMLSVRCLKDYLLE